MRGEKSAKMERKQEVSIENRLADATFHANNRYATS